MIPQALCTVPGDFISKFSYQQEEELYYMEQKRNLVTLGSTGITVEKNSFGALPIQRTPFPKVQSTEACTFNFVP